MRLSSEEQQVLLTASRFCREILAKKSPSGQQIIDVGIALRALELFPKEVPGTAIEIGIVVEHGQSHESWVLQIYGNSIQLHAGGSEWSHGYDHFTRFRFHVEPPGYCSLEGDISQFEELYKDIEWSRFRLYSKDEAPRVK